MAQWLSLSTSVVPCVKLTFPNSHMSSAQPCDALGPLPEVSSAQRSVAYRIPFHFPPILTSYTTGVQGSEGAGPTCRTKHWASSCLRTPPPHCFLQGSTGWTRTLAARPTPSKSLATSRMVDRHVSSPSQPPRYPSAPCPSLAGPLYPHPALRQSPCRFWSSYMALGKSPPISEPQLLHL